MAYTEEPSYGGLADAFHDFDKDDIYQMAEDHVTNENSKNFVVEFAHEKARIAFDLTKENIDELLARNPDDSYPIRWINIWDPSAQRDAMKAISDKYEFSRRLYALMIAPRFQQEPPKPKEEKRPKSRHQQTSYDPEKALNINGSLSMKHQIATKIDDNLALYQQVKDTVNYFSTDQTQKAFCIGANWLHKRPLRDLDPPHRHHRVATLRDHHQVSILPPKHWQWLALCNNHTVLSIHEMHLFDPVPEGKDKDKWHRDELECLRAHTRDVLRQLSKRGYKQYASDPLAQITVRQSLKSSQPDLSRRESGMSFYNHSELGSVADEGTSNLFHYLFEDYGAAGSLKAAESELEAMTRNILDSTRRSKVSKSSEIIPTLHYLSKDLREFKHLFENYKNLISKIMAVGRHDSHSHRQSDDGIFLTSSALSRFDRLGDRLQYLMLNTIEGYLEEIAALSTTYFNLTQQKDSQATARLTRSATLLAKLSVFFLPISFMTSYFSIQIEDLYIYWTGQTYWYAFAVIASVSFLSLFFFSRLLMFFSDVMDDWAAIIGDWGSTVLRTIQGWVGMRSRNDDDDIHLVREKSI
ncbi:hypothetical protein M426DRAFT_323410 [Hypoxylon sp. CI-4A]|nr:hypothetical protein M426DRAFT_323410 [Hypoxylon sp. CI-4A]